MSNKDPRKFLFDIIVSANDIEIFVAEMTIDEYSSNSQVKAAVERKFEIIGEALNRIKRVSPDLLSEISDYNKIITFRNILAHGYDVVSDPIVWDIIQTNLSQLLRETNSLLDKLNE